MISKNIAPIPGNQTKYISLIYVQDLVKLIEKCIYNTKAKNKIFHATDENTYTINEFVQTIAKAMNKKCLTIKVPDNLIYKLAQTLEYFSSDNKDQILLNRQKALEIIQSSWLLDGTYTMKTLNFTPSNSLLENLKQTYIWYKLNNLI